MITYSVYSYSYHKKEMTNNETYTLKNGRRDRLLVFQLSYNSDAIMIHSDGELYVGFRNTKMVL